MRLAEAEAAAQGRLERARALLAQYEDTITELSQDASALTAGAQSLREENSGLAASLDTARAEADHLQVRVAPSLSESVLSGKGWQVKGNTASNLSVYCLCPGTGEHVKSDAPRDLSEDSLIEKEGMVENVP